MDGVQWFNAFKQDRQCIARTNGNAEQRSPSRLLPWKNISNTYSECVFVAVGMQRAMDTYLLHGLESFLRS